MKMEPRPYDLNDPEEIKRLHRELWGYMRISVEDGTDLTGRQYAFDALTKLVLRDEQKE